MSTVLAILDEKHRPEYLGASVVEVSDQVYRNSSSVTIGDELTEDLVRLSGIEPELRAAAYGAIRRWIRERFELTHTYVDENLAHTWQAAVDEAADAWQRHPDTPASAVTDWDQA